MTDYTELKRLAEASLGEWYEFGELRCEDRSGYINGLHHDDEYFIVAANPSAVLALIAENDRLAHVSGCHLLRAQTLEVGLDQLRAEVAGLKTGYEAYERVSTELKAENEALRLALESCADELEGQVIQCYHGQPVEDMHPVVRHAYDRDMLCVTEARAAMGKGHQS